MKKISTLIVLLFFFVLMISSSNKVSANAYACWPGGYDSRCTSYFGFSGACSGSKPYCHGYCDASAACAGNLCWSWGRCRASGEFACSTGGQCVECAINDHCVAGKVCNATYSCVCPQGTIWVGNRCAAKKFECHTKTTCASDETEVLSFEGTTHAGLAGSFEKKVCCSSYSPLTTDCNKESVTQILRLSSASEGHVELPSKNTYPVVACLGGATEDQDIHCTYNGNCQENQSCLLSVSTSESGSETNLHVAGCELDSSAFENKVCCGNGEIKPISKKTYLMGTVFNTDNYRRISNAEVILFASNDSNTILVSGFTNETGEFILNFSKFAQSPYSTANVLVKKDGFANSAFDKIEILFDKTTILNFEIKNASSCSSDCTSRYDESQFCNPLCEAVNGCFFFSNSTRNACAYAPKGQRKVLFDDGENETVVYCCDGVPIKEKRPINTRIDCPGDTNVVKLSKMILMDGESVKMNVVACE